MSQPPGQTVPSFEEDAHRTDRTKETAQETYPQVEEAINEYSDLISTIRRLEEESVQIKELDELENAYAREVTTILRQFLDLVGKSYELDPAAFPKLGNSVSRIVLTAQGTFALTYRDGLTIARPVDDLSPESLVNVLERILPEVSSLYRERRKKLEHRAAILERVAGELKRVTPLSRMPRMDNQAK